MAMHTQDMTRLPALLRAEPECLSWRMDTCSKRGFKHSHSCVLSLPLPQPCTCIESIKL